MNLKFTADVWGLLFLININYLDAWNERLYMLHICAKTLHLHFTFFIFLKNFKKKKKMLCKIVCSSYESVLSRVKRPSFFPLALHEFTQDKKMVFALRDDERLIWKEEQVDSKRSKYIVKRKPTLEMSSSVFSLRWAVDWKKDDGGESSFERSKPVCGL